MTWSGAARRRRRRRRGCGDSDEESSNGCIVQNELEVARGKGFLLFWPDVRSRQLVVRTESQVSWDPQAARRINPNRQNGVQRYIRH
jgi:hypothetical protein